MRTDQVLRSWLGSCPGPIYGWNPEECFTFVQNIIGSEHSIAEIRDALNRLGYIPQYRTQNNGAPYYCLQLPDVTWKRR